MSELGVRHLRLLRAVDWQPALGVNLVMGRNGAGKSTLLEAIFLAARGRSFRGGRWRDLISEGEDAATIRARLAEREGKGIRVELRQKGSQREARLDGRLVENRWVLAESLPLRLMHSGSAELITGEPGLRRSFIDWNLFHVEPGYRDLWRRYARAREQKAKLLKEGGRDLCVWNQELERYGTPLTAFRHRYVRELEAACSKVLSSYDALPGLKLSYRTGGYQGDLGSALEESAPREIDRGQCLVGPHRDEVRVEFGDRMARSVGSGGQLRLAVMGLQLAAEEIYQKRTGRKSLWLLDDLGSEWDETTQDWCLRKVNEVSDQSVVTLVGSAAKIRSLPVSPTVFHVEQGVLVSG